MLCPLSPKEVGPSPPGKIPTGVDSSNISRPSPRQTDGGDSVSSSPGWYETEAVLVCWESGVSDKAIDVDLAEALEKYVPDWSSNSLVVETYKRWVEAQSSCRRFEREVAVLKKHEGMNTKVKQEIALLHASVGRLKEQVLETKEIGKASQASAAAAYEARDKAVQDLEVANLNLQETQSKLVEVEEKWKTKRHEMQIAYDKLLADHVRLENGRLLSFFRITGVPLYPNLNYIFFQRRRGGEVEEQDLGGSPGGASSDDGATEPCILNMLQVDDIEDDEI
ncbi:hypothetical protein Hanom_Chr05g00423531 [Helianthus anomalus]